MGSTLLFGLVGVVVALSLPQIDEFRRVIKSEGRKENRSAPVT
jgi:hypothetical protein